MQTSSNPTRSRFATAALVAAFALVGCAPDEAEAPAGDAAPAAEAPEATGIDAELEQLRVVVEPFHDYEFALAGGYDERITPCWYHSENGGAMGYHYADTERLEDPTVRLLEPESVMYEPTADGEMEFVGIEYIVPIEAWEPPEPPSLLGETFRTNEELGVYILHVWLGRENPWGLFEDWNPEVSCEHADETEDRA